MSASESDTNKYIPCASLGLMKETKFEQNLTKSNNSQRQRQYVPVRSISRDERQRAFQWLMVQVEVDKFPAYVKQNENSLTFPEKMMMLIMYVESVCARPGRKKETESIGWIPDGKSFVIWNTQHFTTTWLAMFFGQLKFSSFTRKLYRWGFRQIKLRLPIKDGQSNRIMCFGNENFQRDDLSLLSKMRSVTAEKCRGQKFIELSKKSHETNPSEIGEANSHSCTQTEYSVTSITSQQAFVPSYQMIDPEFNSHSPMPKQASASIAGQSMLKQSAAGGMEGDRNIVTLWTSLSMSAPPLPFHVLSDALHHPQLVGHAVRANRPERDAPTYEEQLVAQAIMLYQLQHNFAAG